MSEVHKDVILEALSVLTGMTLKHHTDANEMGLTKELNIFNFMSTTMAGRGLAAEVPPNLAMPPALPDFMPMAGGELAAKDLLNIISLYPAPNNMSIKAVRGMAAKDSPNLMTLYSAADGCQEMFVNLKELLDPSYNYDFTHCSDKSTCLRGDEPYKRPCGWNRIALKVLDKYPNGNAWLGTIGWRSYSVAGEWPVSYHGTSFKGATGITESHYEPGNRQAYGRGIYSTPDIEVASGYSRTFESCVDGKTYKVLMQNRINPKERKKCQRKDYWLIEVPEGTSPEKEKEIVEKSIRPYGILLKEIKK